MRFRKPNYFPRELRVTVRKQAPKQDSQISDRPQTLFLAPYPSMYA